MRLKLCVGTAEKKKNCLGEGCQFAEVGVSPLESATPLLADSLNGSGVAEARSISKNVAE